MADLLGVVLPPGALSRSKYHGAGNLPQFKHADASPYGKYYGVFLSKGVMMPDEKILRIRPTGPNDSGPFFNSRLSGRFGVSRAEQAITSLGSQGPCITICDYRDDYTETASSWYKKIRRVERLYTDGQTVCCYEVWANEPDAYYHVYLAHFCAYTVERVTNSPNWTYNQEIDCYYHLDDAICNWFTIDQIVQRYDQYVWDVLSGARYGHVDPELQYQAIKPWNNSVSVLPGRGLNQLSLTTDDLLFDHGELAAFEWWSITGSLEGDYRALGGEAFYNAATSLPKGACNTIANVLECASTVNDLIHGEVTKLLPSKPKDAWLFYRYQYTTTQLDIGEYKSLTERLIQLAALPVLRSDGSAHYNGITAHCEIKVDPSFLIPADTKSWLETYGFKLSWYNIWDMIPYSFVVDWFFNIGTFLEVMENENWMYDLPIVESWTSFSTMRGNGQNTYFRVPGFFRANCPFLDYHQRSASGKTVAKRVLDSIALFT